MDGWQIVAKIEFVDKPREPSLVRIFGGGNCRRKGRSIC